MQQLLDTYYAGLQRKAGWDDTIAENFEFIGANNMSKPDPVVGKAAYQGVINRFAQIFTGMRVKDLVVSGNRAYALTNYDYALPNGKSVSGDVIEVWTAKEGKLASLAIYLDTLSFDLLKR